jgi:hypothetical protein
MHVTFLCEMWLEQKGAPVLVRPYGGEEGAGYGHGEGVVKGERLRGSVQWFNHPRRRSDGTMLPDIQGVLMTEDSAAILFSLRGRTVWNQTAEGPIGDQLLRVIFETEDARYRWLNDAFCVLEGKVLPPQPATEGRPQSIGAAQVYLCENELL